MNEKLKKRLFEKDIYFYGVLLVIMLIKIFPVGVRYYPYLDDYNQYGVFHMLRGDIFNNIIKDSPNLWIRPVALFIDAYLISGLWRCMWIALLFYTLIHFAALILLEKTFKLNNIPWSRTAATIFCLAPVLYEATYWVSASSRIVLGLFFAILSSYLFTLYFQKEKIEIKKSRRIFILVLNCVTFILSTGFYEQVTIFLFTLIFIITIINRKRIKNILNFTAPFTGLLFIIIFYFKLGSVGSERSTLTGRGFFQNLRGFAQNMKVLFTVEGVYSLKYTYHQGIQNIFRQNTPLFFILIFFSIIIAVFIYKNDFGQGDREQSIRVKNGKNTKMWQSLMIAVLLFFMPLSIFLVIDDPYIYIRNIFIPYIGIAVLASMITILIRKLIQRAVSGNRIIKHFISMAITVTAAFMVFFSMCANVEQVRSLKILERHDSDIVYGMSEELEKHLPIETLWVFHTRYLYDVELCRAGMGSTLFAGWSLAGHLRDMTDNKIDVRFVKVVLPEVKFTEDDYASSLLMAIDTERNIRELVLMDDELHYKDTGEVFGQIIVNEDKTRTVLLVR